MKTLHTIVAILLIVGGLNWGLVGAFGFDAVAAIFGAGELITRIIYILVGLAAVYKIVCLKKMHEACCMKK